MDPQLLATTWRGPPRRRVQGVLQEMKGDYYRYLAEFKGGEARKNAAEGTLLAYKEARTSPPTSSPGAPHPSRLGAQLFRLLLRDRAPGQACDMAKRRSTRPSPSSTRSGRRILQGFTLIMQLLRDNLTLWTSDMADEQPGGADAKVEDA